MVRLWPIILLVVWQQLIQVLLLMALDSFEHVLEPFELIDAVLLQLAMKEYIAAVIGYSGLTVPGEKKRFTPASQEPPRIFNSIIIELNLPVSRVGTQSSKPSL